MYEHRKHPLASRKKFVQRMMSHTVISLGTIAGALVIGILGYHTLEGLAWIDALLNASMILGGMGPVSELHTTAGKLFASFYALFAGLVFVGAVSILFVPIVHRLFHRFHLESKQEDG